VWGRAVPSDHRDTDSFRGASFRGVDLTGATFRDCDLSDVRIVSSVATGLRVSGFGGSAAGVVVDDVDVTAYVAAELDRRHPERVQLREARTLHELREGWRRLDELWSELLARADELPSGARYERVDGEWSFVETLRHLVFAVDVWVRRMLLDEDATFHPLGLPPTDYPAEGLAELGVEPDADVPYADIVALHAACRAAVQQALAELSDGQLADVRTGVPAPAWGTESFTVEECVRVVLQEHCEHRRYADRDLRILEGRTAADG
jgi:uncharacterized damage-inducible protein DinB